MMKRAKRVASNDTEHAPRWRYDGFVSYCTAADRAFAPKVQEGLEKLAQPWTKRRALTVFQDIDDLAATPDLEASFHQLFTESQTLIFLASPGAAASQWCDDEVRYWIRNRPAEQLVVVLTDGTLTFDRNAAHPIVFEESSAAPPSFAELTTVPLYIDMTDERTRADGIDFRRDSEFRAKLTKVAAAVHSNKTGRQIGPREIDSKDLDEQRKAKTLKNVAIAALVTISVLAMIAAVIAETQRRSADDGRQVALSKQLASQSIDSSAEQIDLGSLLSIEAYRIRQTPEALGGMITATGRSADIDIVLHGHDRPLRAVAYNVDGSLLASGGLEGSIILRDGNTYDPLGAPMTPDVVDGQDPTIRDLAFSPTAPLLLAAAQGTVHQWDLSTPQQPVALPPISVELHQGASIQALSFSPDGGSLVSGGGNLDNGRCVVPAEAATIVLTDMASGAGVLLGSIDDCALGVAYSPVAPSAAVAAHDGTISIWDTATPGARVEIAEAHGTDAAGKPFAVQSVAFSPDGSLLASAGWDGTVKIWDLTSGPQPTLTASYSGHDDVVRAVAFSPDGAMVTSGDRTGNVDLWDPLTGAEVRPLSARHSGEVRDVAFHPNGRHLASAGTDSSVIVWQVDRRDRRSISTPVHGGNVRAVAYDPSNRAIITAGSDIVSNSDGSRSPGLVWSTVPIDPTKGPARVESATTEVLSVAVDGTTGIVASGDALGNLTIWQSVDRSSTTYESTQLGCGTEAHGALLSVAFHPTTSAIALGFFDGTIILDDGLVGGGGSGDGARCASGEGEVWDVAFSTDGDWLAASGGNGRIVLWELESDRRTAVVAATEDVRSLSFDPAGSTLAAGGTEGDIVLFDVDTASIIGKPMRGHEDSVRDLAYHPDGTILASGGRDGTLRLWNTKTETELTDPLDTRSTNVYSLAWLLDGSGIVSGSDRGARVWDLRPSSLRSALCDVANRDLDEFEWDAYIGAAHDYRQTCKVDDN